MTLRFILLSIIFSFCALQGLQAQDSSDDKLAAHYFESGDYEKARLYYEKLYEKNPAGVNYNSLLAALTELKDYKEAEKLVKKHMKRFSSNLFYIDLGAIYEATGDQKNADQSYQQAVTTMSKSQGMVIRTANEFMRRNKTELALQTYEHGKKLLDDQYPFSYEIAGLYGSMGDKPRMISEYLDLVVTNDAYVQTVQNALNRSIDFEGNPEDVDLLRMELLRRVQKDPQSTVFAEMLTWLFLQQRDFNSAFVQLKAIDKRLSEDGYRVLNLAGLAINNQSFDVAVKCYRYIAEKGTSGPYYAYARAGELRAEFEVLLIDYPVDTLGLKALNQKYEDVLVELGKNSETIPLLRQKALLEGQYLLDLEKANETLNEALDVPGVNPEVKAEMKLDLAEILVARDYIWDASLLSSQVDKDFKFDVIGYAAKLMNARISYYIGEFDWAQAQLDILKGSTSKLISNNAMALSLVISDNLNMDTIVDPMLKFAKADLMIVQHRYDNAIALFDSINTVYPGHKLNDEILMRRAKISETIGQPEQAITYYQQVLADHFFEIYADDALFEMAQIYETKLKDLEKAQELYKQLMVDFPGSLFVVEARKRFRQLRGDEPNAAPREILQDKIP